MKNYRNLRRLFEQDQQTVPQEYPIQNTIDAAPAPQHMEEPLALPAQDTTPQMLDPMVMTVRDFIAKCKSIDPLVCMGLESFIEKNKNSFDSDVQPTPTEPSQDLTFSQAIAQPVEAPAQVQPFSLDQSPENLNFPS